MSCSASTRRHQRRHRRGRRSSGVRRRHIEGRGEEEEGEDGDDGDDGNGERDGEEPEEGAIQFEMDQEDFAKFVEVEA